MLRKFIAAALLSLGLASVAAAQNCPGYTYSLMDGSTAYGSQVMANFTTIRNCANSLTPSTNPAITGTMFFNPTGSIAASSDTLYLRGANSVVLQSADLTQSYSYINAQGIQFFGGASFSPGSNVNAAVKIGQTSGSPYGGGVLMKDGVYYAGMWTNFNGATLNIGAGGTINGFSYATLGVFSNGGISIGRSYADSTPPTDGAAIQGYLGVGTTSPLAPLDVRGAIQLTSNVGSAIRFSDTNNTPYVFFQSQSDNNFVFYNTDSNGSPYAAFYQAMRSDYSPFVFISAVSTPSDLRLKKNIIPISGALAQIKQLRPVRYNWREPKDRTVGQALGLSQNKVQIGFIAQEVAQVVPEAVNAPTNATDIYTMDKDALIPILVAAIKEQQVEIDALKALVSASKSSN